ncbi:penicillin-binding protein, beta-lactamase class C [Herbaspirillum sp. CF444]|uniref:serine hydrolase domain-containing protein n=1 Tax=Herbaspirillum sp. CF444 TaxID=1144319 RepID=UPI0002723F95|nr:hydrolase [Herbaspirillum sp. CF444]EJL94305.1 penicillin-binding protein, beta-lactamase class C [Herbaspirillum sp. CF444]
MHNDVLRSPPRRGFCNLLIGGSALTLASTGFGALAASLASSTKTATTAPGFTDGFTRGAPELHGVSADAILAFLEAAQSSGFELHSFMLYRRGAVIAEGWWDPYRADRIHMTHSATKSFAVCGVGLALAEGRFRLRDKVVSFFPEMLPADVDPKLAAMTVEDLLTMRTGHAEEVSGSVWRQIKTSWVAEFFKIPVVHQPGTKFVYTSAATYMLSAIISKTTGQPLRDYLQPRLFEPLNITRFEWPLDPHGISPGANGLSCETADLLKLGVLHLQNGMWNGKQVLPREWVAAVQAQHVPGKYGYQWWLGPHDYSARGLFGQYVLVFPESDAVLAMTAAIQPGRNFLGGLLYKHFPAAFGKQPLPDDARADLRLRAVTATLQLLPPLKPSHSPLAGRISGQRFDMEANEDGVRSLQFDFSETRCRFTMTDERGVHTIEAGLRERIESTTSMSAYKLHHEYQFDVMRVSAGGSWQDERTFVMTWCFFESTFRDTVVCVFSDHGVTMERRANVNSGPLARPVMSGRIAS